MSSASSTAPPAFSYAQAAKGLAPAASASHTVIDSSSHPVEKSPRQQKSSSTSEPAKFDLTSKAAVKKGDDSVASGAINAKEHQDDSLVVGDIPNKENLPPKKSGSSSDETKMNTSGTSSPSFGAASTSTLPKDDETPFTPNGISDGWEKQSEVSTSVEKSTQTTNASKSKDSEDDWEHVSVAKVPLEKELKAAPIPVVNFWQARIEAQEAKAKALAAQHPASAAPAAAKSKSQSTAGSENVSIAEDEGRRKQPSKPTASDKEDTTTKRKQGEPNKARDDGRRQQPRQSRSSEQGKETPESIPPPPVGDAESWPTPETAITEERKKPVSVDRAEKNDDKGVGAKQHSKQWIPVPYVPTAKFVTPLPPAAARRGGKLGNRGGRDGPNRGGHVVQSGVGVEKSEAAGSMGPPPLPKLAAEQERGRNKDSSTSSRATSAPTQPRRTASAGEVPAEQRKSSGPFSKDRNGSDHKKTTGTEVYQSNDTQTNESSVSNRARGDSRSLAKPTYPAESPVRSGPDSSRHASFSGDSHSHPKFNPATRRTMPSEFYKEPDAFGTRDRGDLSKESNFSRSHEIAKEKPDYPREKVSWRDRDFPSDRDDRREQRPERGRGSYRGRGNHSSYAMQSTSTHAYTSPLPQQPFAPGKSNSYQTTQRQSSQPYPAMSPHPSQRSNTRSQSIPNSTIYPPATNTMPGMSQALSPIQTDMSMYGYQQPMHPGIMSAVPYNAALDSYALLAMVHSQLEYYFSIDNLCKDMFLRQNMDSQGYVLLSVIAGFKRIKALTEDMDMLRHVCGQLKSIEFRPGEDGVDRLRRKEGWEQWIRPMSERVASARNDGPPATSYLYQKALHLEASQLPGSAYSTTNPMLGLQWNSAMLPETVGQFQEPVTYSNDTVFDDPTTQSPVNTAVPELPSEDGFSLANGDTTVANHKEVVDDNGQHMSEGSPSTPPANGESLKALTKPEENDVFPNEKIAELTVVVRKNDALSPPLPPPFISPSTRTFSHGSIDEQSLSTEQEMNAPTGARLSGLRGGSGSVEQ